MVTEEDKTRVGLAATYIAKQHVGFGARLSSWASRCGLWRKA